MNSTFAGVIRRLYGDIKNFRPAQKSQAFALTTYVLTGCLVLAWPKTLSEFALLLVSNHIIDHVLRRLVFRDARPAAKGQILAPSVIIISCGTFLLLQGYSTWAYLIAGFIGVSSRYIFTVQGQPVFNPANLGVLSIALAFPMLGTSFSDQWVGRGDLIAYMILIGTITAFFANKIVLCATYVFAFAFFAWVRGILLGPEVTILTISSLLGASSILFVFHMMTDPRTSPPSRGGQALYAFALALLDITLRTKAILFPQLIALCAITIVYALYKWIRSAEFQLSLPILAKKLAPTLAFTAILVTGVKGGSIPTADPFYRFQNPAVPRGQLDFKFEDATSPLGIHFMHDVPDSDVPIQHNTRRRVMINSGVAVGDIDGDGFQDLFFTTMKHGDPNGLFRNIQGGRFENATREWGLSEDKNLQWPTAAAAFVDVNRDGKLDLFVAKKGCHTLYINSGKTFEDRTTEFGLSEICSHASSLAIFDFNLDGYPDIYIGNFLKPGPLTEKVPYRQYDIRWGATSYNREGGENIVLLNQRGSKFVDASKRVGANDVGLNWAAGVYDRNGDGLPDLYLANDFGIDTLYLNRGGQRFLDQTHRYLGRHTSRNSMSAEMGDIDGDGQMEIYATQMSRLGSPIGKNLLWQKHPLETPTRPEWMVNIAPSIKVDQCGWGWGAKFADVDNDGGLDLFVVNGYFHGTKQRPYWYHFFTYSNLPAFVRTGPLIDYSLDAFSLADNQPNCLFLNRGLEADWPDVAIDAGITDVLNGRGLATLDLNNDGAIDFAIANHMAEPKIYLNRPQHQRPWVGVDLRSKCHLPILGAKLELACGGKRQLREIYPTNGFNSQSDTRVHFGLGDCSETTLELRVTSPYNGETSSHPVQVGRYNRVIARDTCPPEASASK